MTYKTGQLDCTIGWDPRKGSERTKKTPPASDPNPPTNPGRRITGRRQKVTGGLCMSNLRHLPTAQPIGNSL